MNDSTVERIAADLSALGVRRGGSAGSFFVAVAGAHLGGAEAVVAAGALGQDGTLLMPPEL
jgi:hypothetical protein